MAKSYVGIDIGHRAIKIVQAVGNQVKKTAVVDVPDSLVKEYQVTSIETMAELIKSTMKANGIQGTNAALVLSDTKVYAKNITIPQMTDEQLTVNLPYEFRDYITDELKNYTFDYLVVEKEEKPKEEETQAEAEGTFAVEENNNTPTMDLLAAAAPKELIEEMRAMLRKAGLRLEKAAPVVYAYIGIIRSLGEAAKNKEFCFIDLGHEAIRMHMFKGENFIVSRDLDIGISSIEEKIADAENVDIHLAHTYLISNHDDCQNSQGCIDAYGSICTELQRAINFYEFSNPDSNLEEVYLCGGGAAIERFAEEIKNTLSLRVNNGAELVNNHGAIDRGFMLTLGYGITQD